MKSLYKIVVVLILYIGISSCKKFIEVEPPATNISTESAYKEDFTASSVMIGLYAKMSGTFPDGLSSTSILTELSADNLVMFDPNSSQPVSLNYRSYYRNDLNSRYQYVQGQTYWRTTYDWLYTVNDAISRLTGNTSLTPSVAKRLLGEAYFLRAFYYFYLVNLYGDVPLILTTDPKINSTIGRTSASTVYNQIVADLNQAQGLLDNNYVLADVTKTTDVERLRPNLAAVNALQARVFLYQKKYPEAEIAATKVISQSGLYSLTILNSVFQKNSKETIWSLQSVTTGFNTRSASIYLLPADGPRDVSYPFYLSPSLVNSFEAGDDRKNAWLGTVTVGSITYTYPTKYKVPYIDNSTIISEYDIVLRLGEQYLIRAEARNEQSNTLGAVQDLNSLRSRSRATPTVDVPNPLPDLSTTLSQTQIRSAIMQERRVELFTEWGHRWFDLKRLGTIDALMTPAAVIKGGTWSSYKALYPIPVNDILLNPSLNQNQGYTN